jgi:ABC-type ATPase with predicted acetyltransferase domain
MQQEMYSSKSLYNTAYWDCNCAKNYIHKKPKNYCSKCGSIQSECPDSRVSEVEIMYNPNEESALYLASIKNGR